MGACLLQDGFAVDAVKSVGEVQLHQHFSGGAGMALRPGADSVDSLFSTSLNSHPDLRWPEVSPSLLLNQTHEAFSGEAAKDFTDGYGPHPSRRLGESN